MAKRRKRKGQYIGISLYKRGKFGYYAKYEDPNTLKVVRVSLKRKFGVKTLKDADSALKDLYDTLVADKRRAAIRGPRKNLNEDWAEIEGRYLSHLKATESEAAANRAERDWLRLWRLFREKAKLRHGGELARGQLAEFKNFLGSDMIGIKPSTRNRHLNAVRAMLHVARRADCIRLISDDINESLRPFKVELAPPLVLTTGELRRLLRNLPEHDLRTHFASRLSKSAYHDGSARHSGSPVWNPWGPFVLLALLTGARPGEVWRIRAGDVSWDGDYLVIRDTKRKDVRHAPLHDSPALVNLLKALHERTPEGGQLCTGCEGFRPFDRRAWDRFAAFAGLKGLTPKHLRSTCVAHVASASPDTEYLLEDRFGHGAEVSKKHYRRPQYAAAARGTSVEEWLGISTELRRVQAELGLLASPHDQAAKRKRQAVED